MTFDQLAAGLSAEYAIEAFLDGCNKPERMNISTFRRRQVIPELRRALPDPIPASVADALIDVAMRRRTIDTLVDWLRLQPMTWDQYDVHLVMQGRRREIEEMSQAYLTIVERLRAGTQDSFWKAFRRHATVGEAMDRYASNAHPCPQCGAQPRELRWVEYCSPRSTWEKMVGRAGWITLCDTCRLRIDFFVELLN